MTNDRIYMIKVTKITPHIMSDLCIITMECGHCVKVKFSTCEYKVGEDVECHNCDEINSILIRSKNVPRSAWDKQELIAAKLHCEKRLQESMRKTDKAVYRRVVKSINKELKRRKNGGCMRKPIDVVPGVTFWVE